MTTSYLREGGWTDSSGTEVGSEYSEERWSLQPHQVRSGLSMELDDSTCGFFLKFRDGHQHWISCRYERVCKEMGQRLHSQVMTEEPYPMYSASIRANAHRTDHGTTRIFQNTFNSHMEIPEDAGPSTNIHNVNLNDEFADMWEQDWDVGLQQGTPEGSEPLLPAPTSDEVLQPIPSTALPSVGSDVFSGLGQILVDSVGELEVMWN
ncbi:hypothetical protein LOK49_LG08G00486 [Camellia lanceoleosa]|uniref:Uncharacterized protein n=1 Tax=Camellia lanceoleosa TaxID=1840588 RepID=A0ACC0GR31_9ERIC|nr:hypothetical protein LOK49_LG08G00486 [Camellia lanceoleosa]